MAIATNIDHLVVLFLTSFTCMPKAVIVQVEAKKVEEKKVEQKKEEPKQQESKKRKGPLPMFLAQILMLGAYVGGVYVVLTKSKEMAQLAESIKQAVAGLKSAPSTGSAPSTESAPTTSE